MSTKTYQKGKVSHKVQIVTFSTEKTLYSIFQLSTIKYPEGSTFVCSTTFEKSREGVPNNKNKVKHQIELL